MHKLKKFFHFVISAWIFPALLSLIVYHGFSTNYTTHVFSESGFNEQYESSIYKYRIIGIVLVKETNYLLKSIGHLPKEIYSIVPMSLKTLDTDGTKEFYLAYFFVNTFFLCLACTMLYFLLYRVIPLKKDNRTLLVFISIVSMISISQYVITPYDILSYFLLITALILIFKKPSFKNQVLLYFTMILAVLTRESAILILSVYFTLYVTKFYGTSRKHLIILAILFIIFLTIYFIIRLIIGFGDSFYLYIRIIENFRDIYSLMGLILFLSILYILSTEELNRKIGYVFLLSSLPYIITIMIIANPWELRLWIPVIIPLVIFKFHFGETITANHIKNF